MEAILVKVFATALALSLVTTRPDAVKTQFDPVADQAEVVRILADGCTAIRKDFDIENIDLDDLIETAMTDTQAVEGEVKAFKGIKFGDLHLAYKQLCKRERAAKPVVDIAEVIAFYNHATVDLPDHYRLKGLRLPGMTTVLDGKGAKFAELFEPENRRHWVPLSDIPEHVQKAFIAAEDKRFFQHRGVDERSIIRAFINMIADPKKRQGGSTITQQVAKNLLVGDAISYERKIREIIVATRVEQAISKNEILEIYLNSIFLGRSSWGIELAARAYFGKRAKDLTITEGAFLAGLVKGPNFYNPDRHRERAHERLAYVLGRMNEDGVISADQMTDGERQRLALVAHSRPRRESGFHIVDHIAREAKAAAGIGALTSSSFSVRSTIEPKLQWAAEAAVQDGLARFEQNSGRVRFTGPEANVGETVAKLNADPNTDRSKPLWQQALARVRLPLYDVHWTPAVVVEKTALKGGVDSIRVGLPDGRVLPLSTWGAKTRSMIGINDVVYVNVVEPKGKESVKVELRSRPSVQAAAVVLENKTGRVLAMVGGFSYPMSQINRATQARRQPGSALKPLTYLAALANGLQPNTLVQDAPLTLSPIGGVNQYTRPEDYWTPKNYDGGTSGTMTLRRALENSKNLVTARLLDGGIAETAPESLDRICRLAMEAQLYSQCERYYPFVLGAQPVRPIDLAGFYAAIANEGSRPTPHVIEQITQDGKTVYQHQSSRIYLGSADRPATFQIRTMLQGVLARGTARSVAAMSPFVGGKTGTSDEENDAWFVGFSNDVTIAVWVGYDNAGGRKKTLGAGGTGSRAALPIFVPIMQAVWEHYAPKTPLVGPSPEASRQLIALPIDVQSGARITSGRGSFTEYFRLDPSGRFTETQNRLVSRDTTLGEFGDGTIIRRDYDGTPFFAEPWRNQPRPANPFEALFGGWDRTREVEQRHLNVRPPPAPQQQQPQPPPQQQQRPAVDDRQRLRRVDPSYFWGNRGF